MQNAKQWAFVVADLLGVGQNLQDRCRSCGIQGNWNLHLQLPVVSLKPDCFLHEGNQTLRQI